MRTGRGGDRDYINENLQSSLREAINNVNDNETNINIVSQNIGKIDAFNNEDKSSILNITPIIPSIKRLSQSISKIDSVDSNMAKLIQVANNILTLKQIPENLEEVKKLKSDMCYLVNQTKKYVQYSKDSYDNANKLINDTLLPYQQQLVVLDSKLSNQLALDVANINQGHLIALKLLTYEIKIKPCVMSYEVRSFIEYDDDNQIMTYHIPRPMCATRMEKVPAHLVRGAVDEYLATFPPQVGGLSETRVNTLITDYIVANNLEHLTATQVSTMISDYWTANPDVDRTDLQVNALIEKWHTDNPQNVGLTEPQINTLIATYHDANPQGGSELTDAQIQAVVNPPPSPLTRAELDVLIANHVSDPTNIEKQNLVINANIGEIADMSGLFSNKPTFNLDISGWDVSSVTNMVNMFLKATTFNQPLNSWDVSSVTYMFGMLNDATNFNQDISGWDVSSVTNMGHMFFKATNFNQDISGWSVANVTSWANFRVNSALSTANTPSKFL